MNCQPLITVCLSPSKPLLVAVAAILLCLRSTRADLIVNGGFEDPVLLPGATQTFIPGQTIGSAGAWTVLGNPGPSVILLQTFYSEPVNGMAQFNAEQGLNSIDMTGPGNVGLAAGIRQVVATTPGQQYNLSFYVGRATPVFGPGGPYPTPATVDLSINGGARIPFTSFGITLGILNWTQFNYQFSASGASTTIDFFNGTTAENNEAGLDNVSLDALAPVSEPTALAAAIPTMLFSLCAVMFQRRFRKSSLATCI